MTTQESLAQYQWRFRTNAIEGAYENSVGMQRVNAGLNRIGLVLDGPEHPLGPNVKVGEFEQVPEGTIAYQGDPARPGGLIIVVRRDGVWRALYGDGPPYGVVTLATVPGRPDEPPAWLTTPGTEQDVDLIKAFKARAWKVGYEIKQSAQWCPTFENVLARVDVSAASVREAGSIRHNGWAVGDMLSAQVQAQQLPEGTILFWNGSTVDKVAFMVSVRDDAMQGQNDSWCRRLLAVGTTGNFRTGSTIAAFSDGDPEQPWNIRVGPPQQWLEALPTGTFFQVRLDSRDVYHVTRDGGIVGHRSVARNVDGRGDYQASQFSGYNNIYLIGYTE